MRWSCALLVLTSCRIGFDATPRDGGLGSDATGDATMIELDAAPGTRIVTFGERPTSMVQNVTTDAVGNEGLDVGNYGASGDLSVFDFFERTYLRFDLTSLSTADRVISAKLELVGDDSGDLLAGLLQALRLDESWVEGVGDGEIAAGVTWNDRGTGAAWTTPGGTGTMNLGSTGVGATSGPMTLDLPAATVQAWIDGPATNFGVMLVSPDNGHWHPMSREHPSAAERPQLRVVLMDP